MANVNIKLTKEQQQILLVLALFLGGGGFAYFKYFWIPVAKKITELNTALTKVKKEIEEAKQAQAQLSKIEKALKDLEVELLVLTERLPKERDIPGIIDKVSELTRRHGIILSGIYPGTSVQKQGYIENHYTLSVRASYHDVGRFLAALVLEDRIFNTKDLSFGTPDSEGKFTLTLPLIAYQYSEN